MRMRCNNVKLHGIEDSHCDNSTGGSGAAAALKTVLVSSWTAMAALWYSIAATAALKAQAVAEEAMVAGRTLTASWKAR